MSSADLPPPIDPGGRESYWKNRIPDTFMDGLIEQGMVKGEADGILCVLEARGIDVSPAERDRVTSCRDLAQLHQWITRAATAEKASDIFR